MRLIDSHTHLYLEEFSEDINEVMQRASDAGVLKMMLPSIEKKHHEDMIRLKQQFPDQILLMTGLHPTSVKEDYKAELDFIENQLKNKELWVGIGEIGIDLYWDKTFIKEQTDALYAQLSFAAQFDLAVSLHQRQSFPHVFEVLEHFRGRVRGVMHCFAGEKSDARRALDLGYLLGIGGVITFKNSNLREIAAYTGSQALVVETDAPFLAPSPNRGKRNEPSYIPIVIEEIARATNETPDIVAEKTFLNTLELFRFSA